MSEWLRGWWTSWQWCLVPLVERGGLKSGWPIGGGLRGSSWPSLRSEAWVPAMALWRPSKIGNKCGCRNSADTWCLGPFPYLYGVRGRIGGPCLPLLDDFLVDRICSVLFFGATQAWSAPRSQPRRAPLSLRLLALSGRMGVSGSDSWKGRWDPSSWRGRWCPSRWGGRWDPLWDPDPRRGWGKTLEQ